MSRAGIKFFAKISPMIFGSKPAYVYARYNKKKFHALGKSYSFEQLPVDVSFCPLKLVDDKVEVFYPGVIFNTHVLSFEENVVILKSYDDKLTFIKKNSIGSCSCDKDLSKKLKKPIHSAEDAIPGCSTNVDQTKLYTVKVVSEDESTREVEFYRFDEFFPGLRTKGTLEIVEGLPVVHTTYGSGPIILQSNEFKKDVECVLVKMDSHNTFAEVGNPIERVTVKVVKDLKNNKIVENGNIKGILLGCRDKKMGEEVDVFVKDVYPGSYAFVEDIKPGVAVVELVTRSGGVSKVQYKGFIGECTDKKVSKTMKGVIYDIQGNTFKFRQESGEEPEIRRTEEFETVYVSKKLRVLSENDIKNDQLRAIEYIKSVISGSTHKKDEEHRIIDLFNKYITLCTDRDHLCLFYLQYLITTGHVSESEISRIVKITGKRFPRHASLALNDLDAIRSIFNRKKSLAGFLKLMPVSDINFIKNNKEFLRSSIDYIYSNMENPRIVVESVIDNSFGSWIEYLKKESGNYKRNLFRRMSKMSFRKNDMKSLFKMWLEFEESCSGNVEEVHALAEEFVEKHKSNTINP